MAQHISVLVYDSVVASPGNNLYIENGYVYVEGGVIRGVGSGEPPMEYEAAELVVGGRGRLVVPGFATAHTHLLLYPLRHLVEHGDPASTELAGWVAERLGREEAYRLALLALYELTMHGVTMVVSMDPHTEAVARAMKAAGVRGVVAVPLPGCRYSRSDWREELELLVERRGGGVDVGVAACTSDDVELGLRLKREHGLTLFGHPPVAHRDPRADVVLHAEEETGHPRSVYVPAPGGTPPSRAALGLDAVGIGNPLRAALVAAWQGMGYRDALLAVTSEGYRVAGFQGGVIEKDAPADLVVFDVSLPPGLPPRRETLERLLLDVELRVEMILANGYPLVDQGTHLLIQESTVREAMRLAEEIAEEALRHDRVAHK